MMRHKGALFTRRFRCSYLEMAIDGDRIATDDLAGVLLRQRNRQSRFTGGGGTKDYDQQRLRLWRQAHRRRGAIITRPLSCTHYRAPQGMDLPKRRKVSKRMKMKMASMPMTRTRSCASRRCCKASSRSSGRRL